MVLIDSYGPTAEVLATVADLRVDADGHVTRTMAPKECAQLNLASGTRARTGAQATAAQLERVQAYVAAELDATQPAFAGVTVRYTPNSSDAPPGSTLQIAIAEYAAP